MIEEITSLLNNPEDEEDGNNEDHQQGSYTEEFVEAETLNDTTSQHTSKRTVDFYKTCKDYYEILGVTKSSTDIEIKKNYRKLALQFHPDKNKTSGASEAFKAIGNAFAILSDPDKRRRYDNAAAHPAEFRNRHSNGYNYDYTRGFEEDFNAEEIFNMFFGGGFPSRNAYVYRTNQATYQRANHHHEGQRGESGGVNVLLQIMPILLFIFISLLSTFVPDTPYSLNRST